MIPTCPIHCVEPAQHINNDAFILRDGIGDHCQTIVGWVKSSSPTNSPVCAWAECVGRVRGQSTLAEYVGRVRWQSTLAEWWGSKTRPTLQRLQLRCDNETPVILPSSDGAGLVPGAWLRGRTSGI